MFKLTDKDKIIARNIAIGLFVFLMLFGMVKCSQQIAENDDCFKSVATKFCEREGNDYYGKSLNTFRCVDDSRNLTRDYYFTKSEQRECKGYK